MLLFNTPLGCDYLTPSAGSRLLNKALRNRIFSLVDSALRQSILDAWGRRKDKWRALEVFSSQKVTVYFRAFVSLEKWIYLPKPALGLPSQPGDTEHKQKNSPPWGHGIPGNPHLGGMEHPQLLTLGTQNTQENFPPWGCTTLRTSHPGDKEDPIELSTLGMQNTQNFPPLAHGTPRTSHPGTWKTQKNFPTSGHGTPIASHLGDVEHPETSHPANMGYSEELPTFWMWNTQKFSLRGQWTLRGI